MSILIERWIHILKSFTSKIAVYASCIIITCWTGDVATLQLLTLGMITWWLLIRQLNYHRCCVFNRLFWFYSTFHFAWWLLAWRSLNAFYCLSAATFHCFLWFETQTIFLIWTWFRRLPYLFWWPWRRWTFLYLFLRTESTFLWFDLNIHYWLGCSFSENWCLISCCLWIYRIICNCCRCIITNRALSATRHIYVSAAWWVVCVQFWEVVTVNRYLIIEEINMCLPFSLWTL